MLQYSYPPSVSIATGHVHSRLLFVIPTPQRNSFLLWRRPPMKIDKSRGFLVVLTKIRIIRRLAAVERCPIRGGTYNAHDYCPSSLHPTTGLENRKESSPNHNDLISTYPAATESGRRHLRSVHLAPSVRPCECLSASFC
jgi:hypothetical protein